VIGPEAKTAPAILMYHQPLMLGHAAQLGVDLMLSGHTHHGQIWPFGYLSRLYYPLQHGLYTINQCKLYVSAGIGTWGPPMRLGAPPEMVCIRLHPTPK